ncbi:MAG TPA: type VI secretion system tube protein Hcp [Actinomycetota bacterium]|jgi:type VI secretion system secreted protein Hcp|nr:type VI secretion system tube protein Hcp [Actinomycetota bacterium]
MPAEPRTAAPGAICPPVPALPGDSDATVGGFARVDGIPGESPSRGHRDEIDIVTLRWCVTNQSDPGGGGGAGRAVVDGVVIGKHTDLATVPLVEACATGRHIERVVITLERGFVPRFRFLTIELEDVVVTRVNSSWSGGRPDEEVSLGFNRICWEYRRAPGAGAVRFCFDLSAGQLVEAPEDVVDG